MMSITLHFHRLICQGGLITSTAGIQLGVASLVVGTLLAAPMALAQQQYPYSCIWKSTVTPGAKIQFTSTNGIGAYQGALYMDGKWIINFREGSFRGYGSNWWSPTTQGQDKSGRGTIVLFKNEVPFRSSNAGYQAGAPTKLLTVGLGSTLYYGKRELCSAQGSGRLLDSPERLQSHQRTVLTSRNRATLNV